MPVFYIFADTDHWCCQGRLSPSQASGELPRNRVNVIFTAPHTVNRELNYLRKNYRLEKTSLFYCLNLGSISLMI